MPKNFLRTSTTNSIGVLSSFSSRTLYKGGGFTFAADGSSRVVPSRLVAIAGISLDYWLYFDVMEGFFKPAGSRAKPKVGCEGGKSEENRPLPHYSRHTIAGLRASRQVSSVTLFMAVVWR